MEIDLEKAAKSRVVLLAGEEESLRRRALRSIYEFGGADDFDRQEFEASESTFAEWSASAGTAPFLSDRRTVIVRHLLRQESPAQLDFKSLPETALLVLVADDELGDSNRQEKFQRIAKAWAKVVSGAGGYVLTFEVSPKAVTDAVVKEALRMGKKISPRAAENLAEMCGRSLSRSLEELEKIVLYVGEAPEIREADVKAVAIPSREWNVFSLVDAILTGRTGEALNHIRILIGNNPRPEEAIYRSILPIVSRQLRLLWQGRLVLDSKASLHNLPTEIQACLPDKPNLAKESEYRQNATLRLARTLTLDQIGRCFQVLADTDCRLKGMLPAYSATETLERMALEMSSTVKA